MNFISEDKMIINLPVPLESEIYEFLTDCNDACLFQESKFNKIFPPKKGGRCGSHMPCHTKINQIMKRTINISNLDYILDNWGIKCFKTEEEALAAGSKLINQHREEMLKLGLEV